MRIISVIAACVIVAGCAHLEPSDFARYGAAAEDITSDFSRCKLLAAEIPQQHTVVIPTYTPVTTYPQDQPPSTVYYSNPYQQLGASIGDAVANTRNQNQAIQLCMEGKGYNYQPDQTQASRAPVAAAPANTTIIAKLVQNNAWMKDPKYVKEQDRFMAIGDQLHAEDPSLKGAEFLAVLGGRFNREYPGLFKGIDGTVPASVVTSVSPPVHRGSKLLQEWLNANPWYTDVKYAKQAARIKQIDNELSAENPNLNIDKCG